MAVCIWSLNPSKTLYKKNLLPSPFTPYPTIHCSQRKPALKFKCKITAIYASLTPSFHVLTLQGSPSEEVLQAIRGSLFNCLLDTNLHLTVPGLKSKTRGKVRDIYHAGDYIVLVTMDQQSAFDRVVASVPFKGQVMNEMSFTPSAIVSAPDKNVIIAKKCTIFPIEFAVRGFITGSTNTSLWTVYKKGVRSYCGNALPDGLVKNQRLEKNILTPTTKAADHDVPVTPDEIIEHRLMTKANFDEVSRRAPSLFEYGQHVALEHGLILVDTKYEFGKARHNSSG